MHTKLGQVSTMAGNGIVGGSDGVGASATFIYPRGIAIDMNNKCLYVSDFCGDKIRKITLEGIQIWLSMM